MNVIKANWPAPNHIKAMTTTRQDGFCQAPYDSNSFALHAGEESDCVKKNRKELVKQFNLPNQPEWLEQTHSAKCVVIGDTSDRKADAAVTREKDKPLVILTADCLPILLCDRKGSEVAAIHGGWRGLASGVIENTLKQLEHPASELIAWIGPGICENCFETGDDVVEAFAESYPDMRDCFKKENDKWHANLKRLAKMIMAESGIVEVYTSDLCTKENKDLFSYRRDGKTGRMASIIWFEQE